MKKYIIVLFSLLALSTSCTDYLDKQPDDMKTDEMVWSSRMETEKYLANCYGGIPTGHLHQHEPWVGAADECNITWNFYQADNFNRGDWTPSSELVCDRYARFYQAIRATLTFENNVDRCGELSSELKTRYKAEVRFLRGYYYYLLLRQYGPIVLIKELLPSETDFANMQRAPYDECVEYICQMMDLAAYDLPMHYWDDQTRLGRPNKLVCLAVKAIVRNLAASPQFNGNTEYANFKNHDGTPLINTIYSEQKWKDAAAAAKAVIDMAEKYPDTRLKLYRNDENGDTEFNPYKSCVDVQLKAWNCEVIWARSEGQYDDTFQRSWMVHNTPGPHCLGGVSPTLRLVDAFLMKNGKPIDVAGSGYVEKGFAADGGDNWNPNGHDIASEEGRKGIIADIRDSKAWGHWKGDWNMFCNREPRFYAAILYNHRVIPSLSDDKNIRNEWSTGRQKDGFGRAELYLGGAARPSINYANYSKTGMLVFKRNDPQADMYNRAYPQNYACTYIRYAEILLDYIEALSNYDPTNADIRKYWDQIRKRAGVESAFVATPEIASDPALMHEYIIRERQIELCFEGDRYFTTRRLWKAHTPDKIVTDPVTGEEKDGRIYGDGGSMWGMNVDAGDVGSNDFNFEGFYKRAVFEERKFNKEYYLFPIPQKEMDKCPGLVQNPWWSGNTAN